MDLTQFWQELTARPDFWGFVTIPITAAIDSPIALHSE